MHLGTWTRLLGGLTIAALVSACGSSGSSSPGGTPGPNTFTNGGVTLTAETTTTDSTNVTTVKNAQGTTVLVSELNGSTARLTFPGQGTTEIPFNLPVSGTPSDFAAKRLAIFVAGQVEMATGTAMRPDNPGCDWFPDTRCTLGCCAMHDQCYQLNGCTASSWLPLVGSDACDNCNSVAANCIASACSGVTEASVDDTCYDNRCGEFYSCTGTEQGVASCECTSPCTEAPSSCGNGTCEVLESAENCVADCVAGAAVNQCCVESSYCPSETEDTCPGGCCCCGYGETCQANYLCGAGDAFKMSMPATEADAEKSVCLKRP